MDVLLVGGGGREHALAEALKRAEGVNVHAAMPSANPGIVKISTSTLVCKTDDTAAIVNFAKANGVSFAVFGPESPLAAGVADSLLENNIPSFGPLKALARLESSKSFTRELCRRHGIQGQPQFKVFDHSNSNELSDYCASLGEVVIKPDGLTGGKGVKVQGDHFPTSAEGAEYAHEIIAAGGKAVVEEKLEGVEFSLMSITDGTALADCPPVQDHKRLLNGDRGPNTGGMGSYSTGALLPFMVEDDLKRAHSITENVLRALSTEVGKPFMGVLYGGFIITAKGVKLLEYNVRFGDPEAMNVLPIMKTPFAEVARAVTERRLKEVPVEFDNSCTVCKYVVPQGYPENGLKGAELSLSRAKLKASGARVFFSSVEQRNNKYYTLGSRAIAFVGIGKTLQDAERASQAGVHAVSGPVSARSDVGTQALVARRVEVVKELRGISTHHK